MYLVLYYICIHIDMCRLPHNLFSHPHQERGPRNFIINITFDTRIFARGKVYVVYNIINLIYYIIYIHTYYDRVGFYFILQTTTHSLSGIWVAQIETPGLETGHDCRGRCRVVQWARNRKKKHIELTKRSIHELLFAHKYGIYLFYIDDKSLIRFAAPLNSGPPW